MTLSPKNPVTAVLLGLAAVYFLTQHKASAATVTRPYGATTASRTGPVASYYRNPSTAAQYASYGAGRVPQTATDSPLTAGLNFLSGLVKLAAPGANPGTPFVGGAMPDVADAYASTPGGRAVWLNDHNYEAQMPAPTDSVAYSPDYIDAPGARDVWSQDHSYQVSDYTPAVYVNGYGIT